MRAAWRTAGPGSQSFGIKLKLGDRAAESVAVHAKLAGSFALVALAVLQDGENEALPARRGRSPAKKEKKKNKKKYKIKI